MIFYSFFRILNILTIFIVFIHGSKFEVPSNVKTSLGYVQGKTLYLPSGKAVEAYRGIPYAQPPIGELRYKHPLPVRPWTGVLKAREYGKTCLQIGSNIFSSVPEIKFLVPTTPKSEDCLTLNIFVPYPRPTKSSVMVFIHGGAYVIGGTSAPFYDGTVLAGEENIIVVSINYRLGVLGFLYLDHPEIHSNCGLMDQLLALRWVNQHIASFGGNPHDVTLFGQSAGGMSIGLQLASRLNEGLFHRAILESGTSLSPFLFQERSENVELALNVAEKIGCNSRNIDSIVRCLKRANPQDLINVKKTETPNFTPVPDDNFFNDHPIKAFGKQNVYRKLDIMTGVVKDEGTMFLAFIKPIVFTPVYDKVGPYHEEFIEGLKTVLLPNESELTYKMIELLYTDWGRFNESSATLKSAESLINDYIFFCPMKEFIKIYSKMDVNVYTYVFNYRSPSVRHARWIGVPHTEELRFVMGSVFCCQDTDRYSQSDLDFSRRIMRYWANFARTGNPNLSPIGMEMQNWIFWPRYKTENGEALNLTPGGIDTTSIVNDTKCTFWNTHLPYLKQIKR